MGVQEMFDRSNAIYDWEDREFFRRMDQERFSEIRPEDDADQGKESEGEG